MGSGKAGVPQAIEIEVMTLLPPVTVNSLQATRLPPSCQADRVFSRAVVDHVRE